MDIVEVYLRYVKLQKAKKFLKEDDTVFISQNTKMDIEKAIDNEIVYAEHLINNPWLISKEIG